MRSCYKHTAILTLERFLFRVVAFPQMSMPSIDDKHETEEEDMEQETPETDKSEDEDSETGTGSEEEEDESSGK